MASHRTRLRDSRSYRFDVALCVVGLCVLAWALATRDRAGLEARRRGAGGHPAGGGRRPVPDGPRQRGRRDRDRLRLQRPDVPAVHVRRPGRHRGLGPRGGADPAHVRQAPGLPGLQRRRRDPGGGRRRPGVPRRARRRGRDASRAAGDDRWPPRRTSPSTTSSRRSRSRSTPTPGCGTSCSSAGRCWRSPASSRSTCSATSPPCCCATARGGRSSCSSIPLVTLLLATRAITRGREDQRRLTVLLEAAVRVQSAHQNDQIGEALLYDARRLIRLNDVGTAACRRRPAARWAPR